MKCLVRPWLKLVLTVSLVLVVYLQSINNPISRFDDPFIFNYYGINSSLSFLDVVSLGSGFYYRPIISLSYWFDSRLWGLDPTFMHLENIVVHLVNVLFVFLIAKRLPATSKIKSLPFLCALLFGLHPINTESVNWIAGRTDPIAGMFIFLAVYCLIRAIQEQSKKLALCAFGVAFAGILAKETAIMFIPVTFVVISFWPVLPQNVHNYKTWRNRFLLIPSVISTGVIFFLMLIVYVRGHGNNAVSLILEGGTNTFIRSLEAFGFYVKKLLLPLPLNVAIVKVNPLYTIVGVITLCVLIVMFRRVGIPAIFLTLSVLFTLPALIVATTSIAWTPYGERYLYIPSAFAVIGCLELFYRCLVRWNAVKLFIPIVSIIILSASIATYQRGMLWGDNLALIEDIVAKSPNFGVARNEYGALLILDRRYDDAEKQFRIALKQNNQDSVNRIIHNNLIGVKINGKSPKEARSILISEIGNTTNGDIDLLKLLYKCDENILVGTVALVNKVNVVAEMNEINDSLYLKTNEPHYLYRSGQLALSIGNKQKAATYFRKTYKNAHPDAYYREPARKLAEELSAE